MRPASQLLSRAESSLRKNPMSQVWSSQVKNSEKRLERFIRFGMR